MATMSATTTTPTALLHKPLLPRVPSPVAIGLPKMEKRGNVKVMCSMEKKGTSFSEENGSTMGKSASLVAAACAATVSNPAMALVDDRMSTEGTGLPFGLSNNVLGWILFGVFGLIWALYFVYTSSLEEDEESGLSL
ncbi:Photosystem II reaction center W protein [Hibiscus syriacus]|uniref:PSII 6.1 kDa protein n=1 Tax=Hibiscus syriacus TaxID=106335 RepID=A0A6A3AL80_HIBSY|nr:photosystem II reaction center W protein, chloroplastic-like [Hibiscus syriacus]KAE8704025.1 Photosystem II reaction center W protein [Hibiscus syriacus]